MVVAEEPPLGEHIDGTHWWKGTHNQRCPSKYMLLLIEFSSRDIYMCVFVCVWRRLNRRKKMERGRESKCWGEVKWDTLGGCIYRRGNDTRRGFIGFSRVSGLRGPPEC
ncbi:hypothetical protein V6Z12_D11G139700 [Gossypium hirsutum]